MAIKRKYMPSSHGYFLHDPQIWLAHIAWPCIESLPFRTSKKASKPAESGAKSDYMRIMPRDETERQEQRKAARLALDTSHHASLEYQKILQQCASPVSHLSCLSLYEKKTQVKHAPANIGLS